MKLKLTYRVGLRLMNILAFTWRLKYNGREPAQKGIVVFWHGFMLPGWFAFKNLNAVAVISRSKDGELLANLLQNWGFEFIRGSSSKGGKEVLQQIIEKASKQWVLMTPDGPRGPRKKMKPGAIVAAQRAKVPLYLCGINVSCKYTFKRSWDGFLLPLPFARIEMVYSEPLFINENLSNEEIDKKIKEFENRLIKMY